MNKKIPFILFLMVFASCASNNKENSDVMPNFDTFSDVSEISEVTDTGEIPKTKVDEDFRIAFLYMGRFGSSHAGRTDLFVMDSNGKNMRNITGKLDWSCQDGCIMHPDFKALGVFKAIDKPDTRPDLLIYSLDQDLNPAKDPVRTVKSVLSAHLTRAGLFFMRKGACPKDQAIPNTFCMYLIKDPLDKNSPEKALFTFPSTTQDARNSTFSGIFRATPDGDRLLLLRPTIYSQQVFIWQNGTVVKLGDEVCHQKNAGGGCTGSGSEYSDRDPIGISPDRSTVVAAMLEQNRDLRLRKYKPDTPQSPGVFSNFYSVKGPFNQLKCTEELRKPWQYTDITGDIRFTADSKSIVFIAAVGMNCPNVEKPQTDIIQIPVALIGSGKTLTKTDLTHITHNTNAESSQDIRITDFSFSPSGKYVVFIGTPRYQTDGTPIPDSSPRHKTDHEVYITSADGSTEPLQLTNSLDYMAVSVWIKK